MVLHENEQNLNTYPHIGVNMEPSAKIARYQDENNDSENGFDDLNDLLDGPNYNEVIDKI